MIKRSVIGVVLLGSIIFGAAGINFNAVAKENQSVGIDSSGAGTVAKQDKETKISVNCDNSVVTVSRKLPLPANFDQLTEKEKLSVPVEEGVTLVVSDDPEVVPAGERDPKTGRTHDRFKNENSFDDFSKKAQKGCRYQSGSGGGKLASLNMTASTGWYFCTAEAYAKNLFGQKVIRLVQTQDWYNSAYQTPSQWLAADADPYWKYLARPSGSLKLTQPYWKTYPWTIRSAAKQAFVLDYRVFNVQLTYLSTWLEVGPGNQCVASPGWGPGMR